MSIKRKVIFVEGSDYAGKTTFINEFVKHFDKEKVRICQLKEPFGPTRDLLLSKDANLTALERRHLFAACHESLMSYIYKNKDNFDLFVIDRSAAISDLIYGPDEIMNEFGIDRGSKESVRTFEVMTRIMDSYATNDIDFYNNFFFEHSAFIMLKIDEKTFKERLSKRTVDESDLLDSKSVEFKLDVRERYQGLFHDLMYRNMRKEFPSFCRVVPLSIMVDCNDIDVNGIMDELVKERVND